MPNLMGNRPIERSYIRSCIYVSIVILTIIETKKFLEFIFEKYLLQMKLYRYNIPTLKMRSLMSP